MSLFESLNVRIMFTMLTSKIMLSFLLVKAQAMHNTLQYGLRKINIDVVSFNGKRSFAQVFVSFLHVQIFSFDNFYFILTHYI